MNETIIFWEALVAILNFVCFLNVMYSAFLELPLFDK